MLNGLLVVSAIALLAGLGLVAAARRLPANTDTLVEAVDALLPQTQCAQCGYPGCAPYARAIVHMDAPINRCPPGGQNTIDELAKLLGRPGLALDEELPSAAPGLVAVIDEDACIGCARCLPACPVDAILGAHQFMHTVIADECTGCELCIAPCPVDCISMSAARMSA